MTDCGVPKPLNDLHTNGEKMPQERGENGLERLNLIQYGQGLLATSQSMTEVRWSVSPTDGM